MLELCRRVGFGASKLATPIFGGPVIRQGSEKFITAEDNEATIYRRIRALDAKAQRNIQSKGRATYHYSLTKQRRSPSFLEGRQERTCRN